MITSQEQGAFQRALDLAALGPEGENPRVGCVLLGPGGAVVGEGWHRGAGTPHAEVAALAEAGGRARGATALVSLEPCAHTGRTGPCTQALSAAGVTRVLYGCPDPDPVASGGEGVLRAAGVHVQVVPDLGLRAAAASLLRPWSRAHRFHRPLVTWKWAASLDGRTAAADGSSRWVTGRSARLDVHLLRAAHDTVLVGTGTALADDPALTVRGRVTHDRPTHRAVMGLRDLPPSARLLAGPVPAAQLRTRNPREALDRLWQAGARRVLLEGGATLAAAFVTAGLVDDVVVYIAPKLLGAGPPTVADLGVVSIREALPLVLHDVAVLDQDVRLTYHLVGPEDPPVNARAPVTCATRLTDHLTESEEH